MAMCHLTHARRTTARAPAHGVPVGLPLQWTFPTATYIIATNPRSGSWLLSEGLASTSLAGNPREWFNRLEEQQYCARWRMEHSSDLGYATYLRLARAESASSNGISGIKLHYYQFAELPNKMAAIEGFLGLTAAQVMAKLFPNASYIWLRRRDRVRQAISFVLASKTNEWWRIEGSAGSGRSKSAGDAVFDPHAIARMEHVLNENDAGWQSYFQENRIEPFIIHYEDLLADYAAVIVSILKWLQIPDADTVTVPPPRLRRQSNATNEEWFMRYTEFKNTGRHLGGTPASDGTVDPLSECIQKTFDTIPNAWKQWVGQSRLLGAKDEAIVQVLINNGYSRAAAGAEVEKVKADLYLLGATRTLGHLQRASSVLNALGQMARLDSRIKTIDRRSNLSRNEFHDRYYAANRPVLIERLMTGWRATSAWTPDYLKRVAGDQTIEVMTAREADPKYELNATKHRTEMRFSDYVDMVYSGKATNDYYLVANNQFFQRPEMQPLLRDFAAFPQYLNPTTDGRQCFLSFGPAGTVTPLHYDRSNILIAQVVGRKRYRLIPPSQWEYVYNTTGVFSDVDCDNPDLNRHPKFRNATVIDVVVGPGEVLFMPVCWWHHVRALDVSITVSFTNFIFPNNFTSEQ
jgi:LPS sulfotransferase NodH